MDTVNLIVVPLAVRHPGEDVYFMSFPFNGSGQFRGVNTHTPDRDGMKGFP